MGLRLPPIHDMTGSVMRLAVQKDHAIVTCQTTTGVLALCGQIRSVSARSKRWVRGNHGKNHAGDSIRAYKFSTYDDSGRRTGRLHTVGSHQDEQLCGRVAILAVNDSCASRRMHSCVRPCEGAQ